jgi:hypothetical protein
MKHIPIPTRRVIKLNPGYASILMVFIIIVLFFSGWKPIILPEIPNRVVIVFFVCWFISLLVAISHVEHSVVTSLVLYVAVTTWGLLEIRSFQSKVSILVLGFIFGFATLAITEWLRLSPILATRLTDMDTFLILSIMISLCYQESTQQVTLLTITLLFSNGMSLLIYPVSDSLAGLEFQDLWWQSLLAIRIFTILMKYGWLKYRNIVLGISEMKSRRSS